jgi:putative phage-type endonuclease
VIVQRMAQNTEAWRAWRHRGGPGNSHACALGASDAPVLMGSHPNLNVTDLWSIKSGLADYPPAGMAAQRGHELEPRAREHAAAALGYDFVPACAYDEAFPHLTVSYDGLDAARHTALEIKSCGSVTWREVMGGTLPQKWVPQLQWQWMVGATPQPSAPGGGYIERLFLSLVHQGSEQVRLFMVPPLRTLWPILQLAAEEFLEAVDVGRLPDLLPCRRQWQEMLAALAPAKLLQVLVLDPVDVPGVMVAVGTERSGNVGGKRNDMGQGDFDAPVAADEGSLGQFGDDEERVAADAVLVVPGLTAPREQLLLEQWKGKADQLCQRADALVVKDQSTAVDAGTLLKEETAALAELEAARKAAKAPAIDLGRQIDDQAAELGAPVAAAKELTQAKLNAYLREQDRLAREKAAELAAKVRAGQVAPEVARAQVPVPPKVPGVARYLVLEINVVDEAKVPKDLWSPDPSKIKDRVKAIVGDQEIAEPREVVPGVMVMNTRQTRSR